MSCSDVAKERLRLRKLFMWRWRFSFLPPNTTQQVNSEGVAVSHMKKGGFVGSMAFCRVQKTLSAAAHASDRSDHYDYQDGGMFRSALEAVLHKVRKQGSVVGEVSQAIVGDAKLKRKDTRGFERSHSTVTATSDVSHVT